MSGRNMERTVPTPSIKSRSTQVLEATRWEGRESISFQESKLTRGFDDLRRKRQQVFWPRCPPRFHRLSHPKTAPGNLTSPRPHLPSPAPGPTGTDPTAMGCQPRGSVGRRAASRQAEGAASPPRGTQLGPVPLACFSLVRAGTHPPASLSPGGCSPPRNETSGCLWLQDLGKSPPLPP